MIDLRGAATIKLMIIQLLICLYAIPVHAVDVAGFTPDKQVTYKTVGETELKLHIFNPSGHKS